MLHFDHWCFLFLINVLSHARTVVPECFKDDNESRWKSMEKWEIRLPAAPKHLNRCHYIWHGWWRLEPYTCAQFWHDPIRGFCSPSPLRPGARMRLQSDSARFLGAGDVQSQATCTNFHDIYVKWRRFAQGFVFCGSRKQNITFRPHFPPKTQISRQKDLNNGDAHL